MVQHGTSVTVAVIESNSERRRAFQTWLSRQLGFNALAFASVSDFQSATKVRAFEIAGLIVGLETSLAASMREKDFLREYHRTRIPVVELSLEITDVGFDNESSRVRWEAFLSRVTDFASTLARAHPRIRRNVRVEIRSSEGARVRAMTADISVGGCFLISYDELLRTTENVTLDFGDGRTVSSRVAWHRKWETTATDELPGYGMQFLDLEPAAITHLRSLVEGE